MNKPEIFAMRFCPSNNEFALEDKLILYIVVDHKSYITTVLTNHKSTHSSSLSEPLDVPSIMRHFPDVPLILTPAEADVMFWRIYLREGHEDDNPFEVGDAKYAKSFQENDDSGIWFMECAEQDTNGLYDEDEERMARFYEYPEPDVREREDEELYSSAPTPYDP